MYVAYPSPYAASPGGTGLRAPLSPSAAHAMRLLAKAPSKNIRPTKNPSQVSPNKNWPTGRSQAKTAAHAGPDRGKKPNAKTSLAMPPAVLRSRNHTPMHGSQYDMPTYPLDRSGHAAEAVSASQATQNLVEPLNQFSAPSQAGFSQHPVPSGNHGQLIDSPGAASYAPSNSRTLFAEQHDSMGWPVEVAFSGDGDHAQGQGYSDVTVLINASSWGRPNEDQQSYTSGKSGGLSAPFPNALSPQDNGLLVS